MKRGRSFRLKKKIAAKRGNNRGEALVEIRGGNDLERNLILKKVGTLQLK